MNSLKRKCIQNIIYMCMFIPTSIFILWGFIVSWREKNIMLLCSGGLLLLLLLKVCILVVRDFAILVWEFWIKKDIRTQVVELSDDNYAVVYDGKTNIIWKTETRMFLKDDNNEDYFVQGIGELLADIQGTKVVVFYLRKSRLILDIQPAE